MKNPIYFLLVVCFGICALSLRAMEEQNPDEALLLLATKEEVSSESVQEITDILQKKNPSDAAIAQAIKVTCERLEALVRDSVVDKVFDPSGNEVSLTIGGQQQAGIQELSLMLDSLIERNYENGKK